jgi:hypothetical protein
MVGLLNKIHSTPSSSSQSQNTPGSFSAVPDTISFGVVPALLDSVRPVLLSCQEANAGLVVLIPPNQFWRWKDQWANSLRTAIFSASLIEYLTTGKLISLSHASEILGSEHSLVNSLANINLMVP